MSLINQVLQNVEARQGGAATDGWAGQVKPVLSHQATSGGWVKRLVWGLVLLALAGWLLIMNWPMLAARLHTTGQQAVSFQKSMPVAAVTPVVPVTDVATPDVHPAWTPPQLTKSLFSTWQSETASPVATRAKPVTPALPVPAKTGVAPQIEGEFTIKPAAQAVANPVVSAIEPPLDAANALKPSRTEDESGPKGIVNKQIRPEQEVNVQIQRAVDQEQKGRLNEALGILRQVLNTSPQSEDARQLLAAYLFESKQEQEAVAVLQSGIKQFPGQIGLSKSLAKWQMARGQSEAVLQTLKPAANLFIQDAEVQWMLAMAYQQTGQHAAALPHFERAITLRPGHAPWIVAYAISLQAAGQPAQALQQLQQAYNLPLSDRLSEFVGQRIRQLGGTAVVRSE